MLVPTACTHQPTGRGSPRPCPASWRRGRSAQSWPPCPPATKAAAGPRRAVQLWQPSVLKDGTQNTQAVCAPFAASPTQHKAAKQDVTHRLRHRPGDAVKGDAAVTAQVEVLLEGFGVAWHQGHHSRQVLHMRQRGQLHAGAGDGHGAVPAKQHRGQALRLMRQLQAAPALAAAGSPAAAPAAHTHAQPLS